MCADDADDGRGTDLGAPAVDEVAEDDGYDDEQQARGRRGGVAGGVVQEIYIWLWYRIIH